MLSDEDLFARLSALSGSFENWNLDMRNKFWGDDVERTFTHLHQTLRQIVHELFDRINNGRDFKQ